MSDARAGEVLLEEVDLSRALAIELTALSAAGFLVSLAGFVGVYAAVIGDASVARIELAAGDWRSLAVTALAFVASTAVVVVAHELCHGLAIRAAGATPTYGAGVAYAVFPYASATSEARFTRNRFLGIALAPLVVLTLVGGVAMAAFEAPWLAVLLALNAAGAVGDVWMVLTVLGYPAAVSVVDAEAGLRVYGPPDFEGPAVTPATVVRDVLAGTAGGASVALVLVALVPFVLGTVGVEELTVGAPETPFWLFSFRSGPDGVEYAAGGGGVGLGAAVGLCYGFVRARRRRRSASATAG